MYKSPLKLGTSSYSGGRSSDSENSPSEIWNHDGLQAWKLIIRLHKKESTLYHVHFKLWIWRSLLCSSMGIIKPRGAWGNRCASSSCLSSEISHITAIIRVRLEHDLLREALRSLCQWFWNCGLGILALPLDAWQSLFPHRQWVKTVPWGHRHDWLWCDACDALKRAMLDKQTYHCKGWSKPQLNTP